jgi:2-iminoacetate synthase ThiH
MEECERIGRAAIGEGAIEALIMTGEGIDRHRGLRQQLNEWGFESYAAYIAEICRRYLNMGLLPHTNIGTLEEWELKLLQPYNVSMGMMVETVSIEATRIAHRAAPTKAPLLQLESWLELARNLRNGLKHWRQSRTFMPVTGIFKRSSSSPSTHKRGRPWLGGLDQGMKKSPS